MVIGPGSVNLSLRLVWARASCASRACTRDLRRRDSVTVGTIALYRSARMPISTLRAKSMPSTNSRKPCTKCWRDCSPSVTMSMPQSSCSLGGSRVASRLASSSAGPAARHGGHNLFGSASKAGLGKLPAIVVVNSGMLNVILASGGRPAIEPIVARKQPLAADGAEREGAQKRARSAQLVDEPVAAGRPLGARSARPPLPLVAAHGGDGGAARVRQPLRQHRCVLDRHGGTLAEIGQHGMGGIPQQGDGTFAPTGKWRAVVERPLLPVLRGGNDRTRRRRPHRRGIAGQNVCALARGTPARLAPVVADDGNDIEKVAAPDGIVDEMSPGAEPQIDCRRTQLGLQRGRRSERTPGGPAGKARLATVTEPTAQARPQPVGRNQRRTAILETMLRRARGDDNAVVLRREILDPRPQMKNNVGMGAYRLDQHGLQVAAMDDPVGRAIAFLRDRAEWGSRKHARRARVHDPQLLGSDDVSAQLLAETKRNQDA